MLRVWWMHWRLCARHAASLVPAVPQRQLAALAPPSMPQGDADTVNCLEPHPHHLLTVATSGIEDAIKLWTPSAEEPQVCRLPLGAGQPSRCGSRTVQHWQGCSHNL